MAIALVLVSVLLVASLYMQLMGKKEAPVAVRSSDAERVTAPARAEERSTQKADSGEKRKDTEELKKQLAELREDLKAAKKKLFDHKEAGKAGEDLTKARAEVERQASIQLENTRAELAQALAEIQKLKGDEGKGHKRPAPAAALAATQTAQAAPAVAAAAPVQKVIRELSDSDREKIQRAEAASSKDRLRVAELEKAMKNSKGRGDAATHQLKVARQETTLAKDKFRAVERRVNRLMLERDLMVRAIKDLEKKSGIAADRVELTAEEIAASDQRVSEKQVAEANAEDDARLKLEAIEAAPSVAAEVPSSPTAEAAPATPATGPALA